MAQPAPVTVDEDRLVQALRALDPVSRALLDLSVRRGVPERDIASVVGTEARRIAARRDELLTQVAAALDLSGEPDDVARVRETLKQIDWRARRAGERIQPPDHAPPGEAERQGEPARVKTALLPRGAHTSDGERSRWVLLAATVLSVIYAVRKREH